VPVGTEHFSANIQSSPDDYSIGEGSADADADDDDFGGAKIVLSDGTGQQWGTDGKGQDAKVLFHVKNIGQDTGTIHYATDNSGTAQAGTDYEAISDLSLVLT